MRYPFLALLADGPAHGYELKQALEHRFGDVLPPLNAGQVYTTLQRLERDGLVVGRDVPEDGRQKRVYELTPAGREALDDWVASADDRDHGSATSSSSSSSWPGSRASPIHAR